MASKKQQQREDLGASEVQQRVEEESERGFVGEEVDPTPDSHYTVDGVTSGKPTPETDEKQAEKAGSHLFRRVR